jgi:hypothetical protein
MEPSPGRSEGATVFLEEDRKGKKRLVIAVIAATPTTPRATLERNARRSRFPLLLRLFP